MNYNKEYFDKQFSDYDDVLGNAWGMNWRGYMHLRAEKASFVIQKCITSFGPDCNLLEVGCATGEIIDTYLNALQEKNGFLLGTDISPNAIKICKKKYAKFDNLQFGVYELPNMQLNQRFDCIACIDVLEYFDIKGKEACVENLLRLLSDNGSLVLQIPLQGENVEEFMSMLVEHGSIAEVQYVYGLIWYTLVEKHSAGLVYYFLKNGKGGKIGKLIGLFLYKLLSNQSLIRKVFEINEKLFSNKKSHILVVLKKNFNLDVE